MLTLAPRDDPTHTLLNDQQIRERKSSFVPSFSMPNPEKLLQKLKDEMGGASNR